MEYVIIMILWTVGAWMFRDILQMEGDESKTEKAIWWIATILWVVAFPVGWVIGKMTDDR